MWVISKESHPDYKRLLLTNRDYTVGRADTDFVMLDPSVSRLHAKIRISYSEEAVDIGSHVVPALGITDVSRFGTFLNGSRIVKNVVTSVPSNSTITFGAMPGVTVTAKMYPLNVLLSSVSPPEKTKVRAAVHSLGGKISSEWAEECNLLVMSKLVVTHKALCCLLRNLDIVSPQYLYTLESSCHRDNFCYPDRPSHLPPIEEKGFSVSDSSKFYANPKRRLVFDGKTFIFLTASKFQRFRLLLNLTNAKSVCIAETLSSNRQYFMHIFASVSDPCVLYETGNAAPEHCLAYSVLKENFNRRPILEQEIALAIIESSCETYCNATCHCPISNTMGLLSCPIEYKSWNVETRSAVIRKCVSSLKRFRGSIDDGKVIEVTESKLKRQCGQAPLLLPSTLFDNLNEEAMRRQNGLVPNIREVNTFSITQNNSSDLGKSGSSGRLAPQVGFGSVFIKPKAPVEGDPEVIGDELGQGDSVLEAFGSMPSLSSVLRERRTLPSYEASIRNSGDATRKSHFLATTLGSSVASLDLTMHEKENLTPDTCISPQPSPTDGFLSKDKNEPISADGNDANVKVKVCALVDGSLLPRKPKRSASELPTVDFKRFVKVWPTCYKEALGGRRKRSPPKSKSPIKISLVPFVPTSKVITELPGWHPEGPSQPLNEDTALINRLFDEITALPRVRRR